MWGLRRPLRGLGAVGAAPRHPPRSPRGRGAGLRACGPSLPHPSRGAWVSPAASRAAALSGGGPCPRPTGCGPRQPPPTPLTRPPFQDPGAKADAISGGQGQGRARKPHAERRPQAEHRTGEDAGEAGPLTLTAAPQPVRVGAGTKGEARHPCPPSLPAARAGCPEGQRPFGQGRSPPQEQARRARSGRRPERLCEAKSSEYTII